MVRFPSLLCKLGLQKFLIEDSSISDKGTRHSVSQTLLKNFFFNLFLIGGELLYNNVLASAIQQHESAMGVYVRPLQNPRPPPSPGHLLWVVTEHEVARPASYSTFPRLSVLHAVVCVFPGYFSVCSTLSLEVEYVHKYHLSGFHLSVLIHYI